jgi:hypothetical protein
MDVEGTTLTANLTESINEGVSETAGSEQPFDQVFSILPVRLWAAVGSVYFAFWLYVFVRWVVSSDFHRTPTGDDHASTWMRVGIHSLDILSPLVAVACIYVFIVKPWRRERRLGANGFLLIACFGLYPMDVLFFYIQPYFLYNAYHLNFGSWLNEVPGALTPNGHSIAEPLLAWGAGYGWAMILPALLGCWLIRKLMARGMGRLAVVVIVWAFFSLFTGVDVLFGLALRSYSWVGTVKTLTVFAGHWYQYPLYEPALMGVFWTALTFIAFTRDPKGHTVAERGVDDIRGSKTKRGVVRLLALQGFLAVCYLFLFILPTQLFTMNADSWPRDLPSYFQNGICGAGTHYSCPTSHHVPIQR